MSDTKSAYENIRKALLQLALASMFLALALLLPFLTGQMKELGKMLCPMHIPVLLCGFICGRRYGLGVGLCAPILRSALFGMPMMFPTAVAMAVELAVYGYIAGLLYKLLPKKIHYIYISLLSAMISGRIFWGITMLLISGIKHTQFTFNAFLSGVLLNSVPGIILQIVIIPIIVIALRRTKIMRL